MMKKLLLTSLVTLSLAATAGAAELTETVDRTFDVKPGAAVSLDNVNGAITIGSWDQPRVRVIAHKKVKADKDDVKKVMQALRIEMLPANGGLTVNTHYPRENRGASSIFDWLTGDDIEASVKYEVTVPRSMNLDVSTVNGSVRVTQVSGKHELETTNGKIEVERCAGSLDASTTNGGIDAELTQVTKGQPMHLSTTNGKIEVAVPAGLAVDVDASTTNGSIESDLPVSTTKISRNSLRGSINGGGTPLKLRTTNGGIEIKTVR